MCLVAVRRNDKGIIGRALPFWLKPKQIGLRKESGLLKSKALVDFFFLFVVVVLLLSPPHPPHPCTGYGAGLAEE